MQQRRRTWARLRPMQKLRLGEPDAEPKIVVYLVRFEPLRRGDLTANGPQGAGYLVSHHLRSCVANRLLILHGKCINSAGHKNGTSNASCFTDGLLLPGPLHWQCKIRCLEVKRDGLDGLEGEGRS